MGTRGVEAAPRALPPRPARSGGSPLARALLSHLRMRGNHVLLGAIALAFAGCGSAADDAADGSLYVSGVVRDFETGEPVRGSISVTTRGLEPAPVVTVGGSEYALTDVTPHSVFHVLAAAPPTHRPTYGEAIEVTDADRWDVDVLTVSEAYLAELADAFQITPTASTGVLFARAVDDGGRGVADIPAAAFTPPGAALGPYFLDAELRPAPALGATSASGWAVFFEVEPGVVGLLAEPGSGYTLDMPNSPIAPAAATVANVRVTAGETPLPQNVSFSNDVVPIFAQRGCEACHSGNGAGRDLGNLTLDGSSNLIHRELTEEAAAAPGPLRIDLQNPEASLVLTMPSAEDPPDAHPNITFTGPLDPDYLTILVWIREGALQN